MTTEQRVKLGEITDKAIKASKQHDLGLISLVQYDLVLQQCKIDADKLGV